MNIWTFNHNVSQWLLRWNMINILIGVLLMLRGGFWRGFGSQNAGWGIINVFIALFGESAAQNRFTTLNNPMNPAVLSRETTNMRRILQINSILDVLYIVGGWRFAKDRNEPTARGAGIGIMVQGALLLIFDVFLLTRIPRPPEQDEYLS